MAVLFYVLLCVAVCLACVFVVVQGSQKHPLLNIMLKAFASLATLILAVYGGIYSGIITQTTGFLIVVGLGFCLVGDVLLQLFDMNEEKSKYQIINAGSFSFMLAHFCFIVSMGLMIQSNSFAIIIPILVGILIACIIYFMQKPMKLNYNKSTLSILAYSFALGTSFAFSISNLIVNGLSTFNLLLVVGLVLFFISDLILSMIYFKEKSNHNLYYLNLSTYYAAIIVIACSMAFV